MEFTPSSNYANFIIAMIKKIIKYFDRLEDGARERLSHYVVLYAMIGGIAIVLFWRGVWYTADMFSFLTGPVSVLISTIIMLATGLFVSFFVGDRIILSGLKREKKLAEKTEEEVRVEAEITTKVLAKLEKIERDLEDIKTKIK